VPVLICWAINTAVHTISVNQNFNKHKHLQDTRIASLQVFSLQNCRLFWKLKLETLYGKFIKLSLVHTLMSKKINMSCCLCALVAVTDPENPFQ